MADVPPGEAAPATTILPSGATVTTSLHASLSLPKSLICFPSREKLSSSEPSELSRARAMPPLPLRREAEPAITTFPAPLSAMSDADAHPPIRTKTLPSPEKLRSSEPSG
jgi:hypothetical protein